MSRILLMYHLLFLSSFLETKVVDVRGKPLSRGTVKGMAYAKFKVHKFSYLNITAIGSHYVGKGSECGFACVNIPSCFSFNLAEFQDINGKVLCELLPSDLYNNSDNLVPSQSHHHYSIAVSRTWKALTLFLWKEKERNYRQFIVEVFSFLAFSIIRLRLTDPIW